MYAKVCVQSFNLDCLPHLQKIRTNPLKWRPLMLLRIKNLFAMLLVALAIGLVEQSSAAQTQVWQHPGVLVSQAQLDFVKQQVNNKVEPFYQEFLNAQKSNYGSPSYKPEGPYPGGITQCGSYSNPDDGCQFADDDSAAAYVQALLW